MSLNSFLREYKEIRDYFENRKQTNFKLLYFSIFDDFFK